MKIRNAVIITDSDSELRMTVEEQADFTGNIIFSRDKLDSTLAKEIDRATGRSDEEDTATSDLRRTAVKSELVR